MPYRYHTRDVVACQEECEPICHVCREQARDHWLYDIIPRHRTQIYWYDVGHWITWALFGNDDDGIFGEEPTSHFYCNESPSLWKATAWGCRNSLHNFCFYVIGSAYEENDEFTVLRLTPTYGEAFVHRPSADTVFAGDGSSLYLALHGCKPFLSARIVWSKYRETRFYVGWRCRGNFGIRFNPLAHRKIKPAIHKIADTGYHSDHI